MVLIFPLGCTDEAQGEQRKLLLFVSVCSILFLICTDMPTCKIQQVLPSLLPLLEGIMETLAGRTLGDLMAKFPLEMGLSPTLNKGSHGIELSSKSLSMKILQHPWVSLT